MTLYRLRWIVMVAAIAFLVSIQAIAMLIVMPAFGIPLGHAASITGFVIGVIGFTGIVFRQIDKMQGQIVRQNEELGALNAVSRAAAGSLDVEETMNRALASALEAVHGTAGEIAIEGHGLSEPRKFVQGPPPGIANVEILARCDSVPAQSSQPGNGAEAVTFVHHPELGHLACVTLTGRKRRVGVMRLLIGPAAGGDIEASGRLLSAMGRQIAVAVRSAQLYEDVLRRENEAEGLYQTALDITSLRDAEDTLHSIVERTRGLLGGDAASLCLRVGGNLVPAASSGVGQRPGVRLSAGGATPGDVRPTAGGAAADAGCPLDASAHSARLRAPLRVGSVEIGDLCVTGHGRRRFTKRQQHLLAGLADLAAIAVENARLVEKERYSAVLEERERLSRELHDSLAQVLAYLHLKTLSTLRILEGEDLTRAQGELRDMAAHAHEAYVDVRETILDLRETVSPNTDFVAALEGYLKKFSRQTAVRVDLEVAQRPVPRLAPAAEVQLLRVIQEALTNVRKHAGTDNAHIQLTHDTRVLIVAIEDSGRGFDAEALKRDDSTFGIATMRERVERAGGEFSIRSVPGAGTRVEAAFPLPEV